MLNKSTIQNIHFGDTNTITSYTQFSHFFMGELISKFNTNNIYEIDPNDLWMFINGEQLQENFDKWRQQEGLFQYNIGSSQKQLLKLKVKDLLIPALTYFKCLTFDKYGRIRFNNDFTNIKNSFAKNLATKLSPEDKTHINRFLNTIQLKYNNQTDNQAFTLLERSDDVASCYEKLWAYLIDRAKQYQQFNQDLQKQNFLNNTAPSSIFCVFDKILNPEKYKELMGDNYVESNDYDELTQTIYPRAIFSNTKYQTKEEYYNWTHLLYSLSLVNGIDQNCTKFELDNINTKSPNFIQDKHEILPLSQGFGILSNQDMNNITNLITDKNNWTPSLSRDNNNLVVNTAKINSHVKHREYANCGPGLWLEYLTAAKVCQTFGVSYQNQHLSSSKFGRYFVDGFPTSCWIALKDGTRIRNNQQTSPNGYFTDKAAGSQPDHMIAMKDKNNQNWEIVLEPCSILDPTTLQRQEDNCIYHFHNEYRQYCYGRTGKVSPLTGNGKYALFPNSYGWKLTKSGRREIDRGRYSFDSAPSFPPSSINHNLIIQVVAHDNIQQQEEIYSQYIKQNWKFPDKQVYYKCVNIKDLPKVLDAIKNKDMSMFKAIKTNIKQSYEYFKYLKQTNQDVSSSFTQADIDYFEFVLAKENKQKYIPNHNNTNSAQVGHYESDKTKKFIKR